MRLVTWSLGLMLWGIYLPANKRKIIVVWWQTKEKTGPKAPVFSCFLSFVKSRVGEQISVTHDGFFSPLLFAIASRRSRIYMTSSAQPLQKTTSFNGLSLQVAQLIITEFNKFMIPRLCEIEFTQPISCSKLFLHWNRPSKWEQQLLTKAEICFIFHLLYSLLYIF